MKVAKLSAYVTNFHIVDHYEACLKDKLVYISLTLKPKKNLNSVLYKYDHYADFFS